MSTEGSRAASPGSSRAAPGRAFYGAFATLVVLLLAGILVLSSLVSTSGPRVRHVAAQNEGDGGPGIVDQRLTVSFDRPIDAGDVAAAVEVSPETRHTVTGRGQQVTVSFDQNLLSDTEYAVTVGPGIEDATGTRMDRAYTHEFRTEEPSFTYLERNYDPVALDEIVERSPVSGEQQTLFEGDGISRFARNEEHLAVATPGETGDELRLVPTGPGEDQQIELPSGDRVAGLQFSPTDDQLVFLTVPDGVATDGPGELYRHDVAEERTYPVELPGGEDGFTDALYSRDGQVLLYGTSDGSYYLTGATRRTKPTHLGEYEASGGFDRTNARISFQAQTGSVAVFDAVERRLLELPLAGAGMEISTPTFLHNSDALIYRQNFVDRSAGVTLSEVYIAYSDGKAEKQITALYPASFFDAPAVSHDDRYVLIESTRNRSEGDGYPQNEQPADAFISLYDRSEGRVVEEIRGIDPVWSP